MLEICALASGSNGNCYYIGNGKDAVLIDAGISRRQVMERMAQKGLSPEKIKAIFISHEHADHFRGVRVLSNKLAVPVFMTEKSYNKSWGPNRPQKVVLFEAGSTIDIGDFKVHSFLKNHDAAEPCSFRIEFEGKNVGVFTDIGDEDMLLSGPYPEYLKTRVSGNRGHLSNAQAFELLKKHHHPQLKVVYLSHLSEENNRPDIAASAFKSLEDRFSVRVTNRYAAGEVFCL